MKQLRKTIRKIILESSGYGAKIGPLLNSKEVEDIRYALIIGEEAEVIEIVSTKRTMMDSATETHVKFLDPDVAQWFEENGKSKVIRGPKYTDPRDNGTYTHMVASVEFYKGELYYTFYDPLDMKALEQEAAAKKNRVSWDQMIKPDFSRNS